MVDKSDVRPPWPGVLYKVTLQVTREGKEKDRSIDTEEFNVVLSNGDALTAGKAAIILAEKHPGRLDTDKKFVEATVMSISFERGVWAVDLGHEA